MPTSSNILSTCPNCQSISSSGRVKAAFYWATATGAYYCHQCRFKGCDPTGEILEGRPRLKEIKESEFDPLDLSELETLHPAVIGFIQLRLKGLKEEQNQIFFSEKHNSIAIPTYDFYGNTIGIKFRRIGEEVPKDQRYFSALGSTNEGSWLHGTDKRKLLILEGELDGISAQLSGFEGSILATQTNKLHESQLPFVKTFSHIFVLPDEDLRGRALEESVKKSLAAYSPQVIKLPGGEAKDLNEFFTLRGSDECSQFVRAATQTEFERNFKNGEECSAKIFSFLSDDRYRRGDSTGWKRFDQFLGGGLRANEMSVVNAFAKAGKTSFVTNIAYHLAKQGRKIAFLSFEMDPSLHTYPTLMTIASGVNVRLLEGEENLKNFLGSFWVDFPFMSNIRTLDHFGSVKFKEIAELASWAKEKWGLDYLILDHAGFLVDNMTDAEQNQQLAKAIKKLTNDLGIHIITVIQAPKTKDDLSIQTAYGGMSWSMNCDNFITLVRPKDDDYKLHVKLDRSRSPLALQTSEPVILAFDRQTLTLSE